tara:strand:+ start:55 stop:840 length:786 start_codon:yes stop_codon:yes gene_type:complete
MEPQSRQEYQYYNPGATDADYNTYLQGFAKEPSAINATNFGSIPTFDTGDKDKDDRRKLSSTEMGGVGDIVTGVASIASGIIGGRARREEQRAAKAGYQRELQAYRNLDTSNPYADVTNPFENLTVNQQQADFMAQQSQQAAANTMFGLSAAAGGSGIAALAQAMANQQTRNLQQASATIGAQEAANQRLAAQGEARRQQLMGQGRAMAMQMEASKQGQLLGLERQRLQEANLARQQATAAIVGGVGRLGSGIAKLTFGGA